MPSYTRPDGCRLAERFRVVVENAGPIAEGVPRVEVFLLHWVGQVYRSEQAEAADRAVVEFLDRVEAAR